MCDACAKLLFCLLNLLFFVSLFFFYVLVGVASLYLKAPYVSCETRGRVVIWRFDVGVTWTRMLDRKAKGCSQNLLALEGSVRLGKPLLAG